MWFHRLGVFRGLDYNWTMCDTNRIKDRGVQWDGLTKNNRFSAERPRTHVAQLNSLVKVPIGYESGKEIAFSVSLPADQPL
jgi:hypothetical protein